MVKRHIWELCPESEALSLPTPLKASGFKVNIIALGDVGATLLVGLKLLGGGLIDSIGIYDMNPAAASRYEMEMNQMGWPFETCGQGGALPVVKIISEGDLFDCDMIVFCASKSVPAVGQDQGGDVRMAQFDANRKIAAHYGHLAAESSFKGIFAVVSDPVDPLCKEVLLSSGLSAGQVRGYGLGVMNKRAEYFAAKDPSFRSYIMEGRAYGPHGGDLVIANSIENYDDDISLRLTKLTVEANLKMRSIGFKPYMAPAISSGAISLILTLRGEWNYSSVYLGKGGEGAFLGIKNRIDRGDTVLEDIPLPETLYRRIEVSYRNLCQIK